MAAGGTEKANGPFGFTGTGGKNGGHRPPLQGEETRPANEIRGYKRRGALCDALHQIRELKGF